MKRGADVYRRIRRLVQRGPMRLRVRWYLDVATGARRAQVWDDAGRDVAHKIPAQYEGKIQGLMVTGRPALLWLYKMRGGRFYIGRGRESVVAARLAYCTFTAVSL